MQLRAYTKEDAKTICSWVRTEEELYRWSADQFNKFPLQAEDMEAYYAPRMAEGAFFPLVMVDDEGKPVGHFIIRHPGHEDASTYRFGFIVADPEIRGKGYGRQMLTLGLAFAKEHLQATRITLGVFANNDRARHCYEAVGFREYGRRQCELPVGTWECIEMEYRFA